MCNIVLCLGVNDGIFSHSPNTMLVHRTFAQEADAVAALIAQRQDVPLDQWQDLIDTAYDEFKDWQNLFDAALRTYAKLVDAYRVYHPL